MTIGDDRIITKVVSGPEIGPDIQPVFVGHCPAADPTAVFTDPLLKQRLEEMGYAERLSALTGEGTHDELYLLPLPVRSFAQYQSLFPGSLSDLSANGSNEEPATHESWLSWAVRDFFAAGNSRPDDRICWVIRVPEVADLAEETSIPEIIDALEKDKQASGKTLQDVDLFDVYTKAAQHLPESWAAVELACSIESAGILVMPDFEKLLVPREIMDIPRNRLPNPAPTFYPCANPYQDSHRERRYSSEMPDETQIDNVTGRIRRIAQRLHAWRPDMQWLLSLAPAIENGIAMLRPIPAIAEWLENGADSYTELAHVQFLFPLVYGEERPLTSASGLLAGHIVHKTQSEGVWRSVAGMPLAAYISSWPEVGRKDRTLLRESLGIGVLHMANDRLQLDDERLAADGFCNHAGKAFRSGELMRFIGWLHRSLRDLGEDIIFQLDGRDPVVRNMLDAFFAELHNKGALRGVQGDDAYRLTNLSHAANLILYRIEIAPSFPIDRFVVTFMHDREANSPTRLEVASYA